ncbi:MAG TPA: FtsX-like permease family protein, partial [Rhodothermales bacterium]|nr:FtsX-like permease family protein [Rhodothermales bacterium]
RLLRGDPKTALAQPRSVVLTRTLAARYFPGEDPLGQTLTLDNQTDVRVTGLVEDVPATSHFRFSFLLSLATDTTGLAEDWTRQQFYTYLLLREDTDADRLLARLPAWLRQQPGAQAAQSFRPMLQPLTSIHLHSRLFRELEPTSDARHVYAFSALALLTLLIAGINFVNLTTALATRRAREVGVRKALGAGRATLVRQFLGESVVMSTLSAALAAGLVLVLLPALNALTGKAFTAGMLASGPFVLGLVGVALLVGVAAGGYPAAVLSAYRPVRVLKGTPPAPGRLGLRRVLVVVQFTASVFMLVATGVVYRQLDFIRHRTLGFNQEQLIVLPLRDPALTTRLDALKQELERHPAILSAAASGNLPGGSDWGMPIQPEGIAPEDLPAIRLLAVDADFLRTYEMALVEGRAFSGPPGAPGFLLNQEAARVLGWTRPTEKTISMPAAGWQAAPVLGVVKDFHFRSMREAIGPLVLFSPPPEWLRLLSVRVRPGQTQAALAFLEDWWTRLDPAHPFTYEFFDETFGQLHEADARTGRVLGAFSLVAVFIACLGLFGLAAFTAERRTKEVGIRKVLGATSARVVLLLSREFAALVAIALLFALPVGYVAMGRWLQGFAYHVDLGPGVFVAAGVLALLVALVTVSLHTIRAANTDPVKALRYE